MKLLAIDSSTDWISVAAGDAHAQALFEEPASNAHSERMMPLVRQALAAAGWHLRELDAIAFGAGPGAFTGVRIACAVAQGLALGVGIPLLPIGTLEAMAEEARHRHGEPRVLAALDARMQEIYFAGYAYERDGWHAMSLPDVVRPDAVDVPDGDWTGAGDGFVRYPALAARLGIVRVHGDVRPSARAIVTLAVPRFAAGEAVAAHDALPVYVRHRVALTLAERDAGVRL